MLIQNSSVSEVFEKGAGEICRYLSTCPHDKIVWGLCGGRSPVGLFNALIPKLLNFPTEFLARFRFLQVDERLFEDHNQTGLRLQIFDALLSSGKILESQIQNYPLPKQRDQREVDRTSREYFTLLQSLGGRFHIAILGTGEDGHIAGAFPRHPTSELTEKTFFTYEASPKPPPGRITASLPLLADSDIGVLIVTGESKRQALSDFLNPELSLIDCPAKIVLQMGRYLLLTDLE